MVPFNPTNASNLVFANIPASLVLPTKDSNNLTGIRPVRPSTFEVCTTSFLPVISLSCKIDSNQF